MSGETQATPSPVKAANQDAISPASSQSVWVRHPNQIAAALVTCGFLWRVWLAHATFFNPDEAWHFSLANQTSLSLAYKASLTLYHPPLLVLILYYWRALGTSNLVLRLPCVIAGTLLCWMFWKWLTVLAGRTAGWVGLILLTFLPPMIALSADLRQYTLMLFFAASAAYFLEHALAEDSPRLMAASTLCLYLGLLSHYSAFLFAAALGGYCLLRFIGHRPSAPVFAVWSVGQLGGVALGGILYVTQISKLGVAYQGAQPLHRVADWYLADWYFHPGRDRLVPFLYHGTFGIFRFAFGQIIVGEIAALMFAAGVLMLFFQHRQDGPPQRLIAIFLLLPFVLNFIAVIAGLYPYGRTRQCVFLAVFAIAGVSVFLARLTKEKTMLAAILAIALVATCFAFGTLQGRDMLPLAEQRHQHMDDFRWGLGHAAQPSGMIFTDKVSSFQLGHYLCQQKPYVVDHSVANYDSFQCNGMKVVATQLNAGPLLPDTFANDWRQLVHTYDLKSGDQIWIVQAGWATGLGEALRRDPEFANIEPRPFGRYIDAFRLTLGQPTPAMPEQR